MDTGNDPAQPHVTDPNPPQQPDPNAGTPPAAGADPNRLTFTDPQPAEDLDDAELNAAKEAAKAEGAASPGDGEPGANGGQPQPQPQSGQPQDPAQAGQPQQPQGQPQQPDTSVMIPKARFDEVNGKFAEAERNAAYWRGVAEARAAGQQPGQPGGQPQPQPAQPTPEQRLASIHTAQDELAAKFDNGEITMAEFKRQERDLNNQEMSLREEQLLTKVQPAKAPQPDQNLYLDTLTADLETQHPWVQVFDQVGTDADWGYLKNLAIDNLVQRGIDPRQGDMGRYELRKEIAVLADQFGPTLVGPRAQAKGIALPGSQPQGQPQPHGQQPPNAADQRQKKLELAATTPPNLRSMGTDVADPTGMPSDSRLETMSDDEIGNLPDSVRRRMMGISSA